MKQSSYSIHNLYIPINDAAIFAEELMGISNFSFRAFAAVKFTTAFNNVEVNILSTVYSLFFSFQGLQVNRSSNQIDPEGRKIRYAYTVRK